MIRKALILLLFLISLITIACGQPTQYSRALLWKITGNGLAKPSYLYGTIHYIPRKDFFLTRSTMEAFGECKILATEHASFMQYIPSSAWRKIEAGKFLPQGQTVASLMTPADFDTLTRYMRKVLHLSKGQYRAYIRLKPAYLSGALFNKIYPRGTGYELEFWKWGRARNQNRQYLIFEGLEASQHTQAAIDSVVVIYQVNELMGEIKGNFTQYAQLVKTYQAQDIEAMYEDTADDKLIYDLLVVKRNQSWMPKIGKLIHSQPTFIAVGAAHLAGPAGLIDLLKNAGYTVSPVIDHTVYSRWIQVGQPAYSSKERYYPNDGY